MTDPVEDAKDTVVGELIRAAKDSPELKEAGRELGQSARTVARTINNALLPLAAVNFAIEKAKSYFDVSFQAELSKKAEHIPLQHVVEPKASVAGPALQGLAFTHEEPNLKDMFLNLLATAMDGRKADNAHPAFVEIIKQLTSEEGGLVRHLLSTAGPVAIVEIRKTNSGDEGWHVLMRHLINLVTPESAPVENPRLPAMIDNWIRLGLVVVDYDKHLIDKNAYNWVEGRPEYQRLRNEHEKAKISFQKGTIVRTALGLQFAHAVGLL